MGGNEVPKPLRRHGRRKAPELPEENERSEIHSIAQRFTYMRLLWIDQPSETFRQSLDKDYDPVDRFQSEEGWLQAQLRELLDALPQKWHEQMKDDIFINTVSIIHCSLMKLHAYWSLVSHWHGYSTW
jgi:hypothetical protein